MCTTVSSNLLNAIHVFYDTALELQPAMLQEDCFSAASAVINGNDFESISRVPLATGTIISVFSKSKRPEKFLPAVESWKKVLQEVAEFSVNPADAQNRRKHVAEAAFDAGCKCYLPSINNCKLGRAFLELARAQPLAPKSLSSQIGYYVSFEDPIPARDFDIIDLWFDDANANTQRTLFSLFKKYFCSPHLVDHLRSAPPSHVVSKLYNGLWNFSLDQKPSALGQIDVAIEVINERKAPSIDQRPLAVVIHPTVADPSSLLFRDNSLLANILNAGFRIMYFQVANTQELASSLSFATENCAAQLLAIYAGTDIHGLMLADRSRASCTDIEGLSTLISERVVNGGIVAVMGNETAVPFDDDEFEFGIAGAFSRSIPNAYVLGTRTGLFANLRFHGRVNQPGFRILIPHFIGDPRVKEYVLLKNGRPAQEIPTFIGSVVPS